jgi:hypothetical protein
MKTTSPPGIVFSHAVQVVPSQAILRSCTVGARGGQGNVEWWSVAGALLPSGSSSSSSGGGMMSWRRGRGHDGAGLLAAYMGLRPLGTLSRPTDPRRCGVWWRGGGGQR